MTTVLITGGSRGIGAATARLAAQAGYAVGLSYRQDAQAAVGIVREIEDAGGRALAVQPDVGNPDDVERIFDTVQTGLGHLHALVSNAGTLERQARVDELDAARLQRVLTAVSSSIEGPTTRPSTPLPTAALLRCSLRSFRCIEGHLQYT